MNFSAFNSSNWSKLDLESRKSALQSLENEMAERQGRPARQITAIPMPEDEKGRYDLESPGNLLINIQDLISEDSNPFELMKTVIHEGRHAYQDDLTKDRIHDDNVSPETIELWRKNMEPDVYFDGETYKFFGTHRNYPFYYVQPIEHDAEGYAVKVMNELRPYLEDDPVYNETMDRINETRNDHLQEAAALLGDDYEKEITNLVNERYEQKHEKDLDKDHSDNLKPQENQDEQNSEPPNINGNNQTAENPDEKYDFLDHSDNLWPQENQDEQNSEQFNTNNNEDTSENQNDKYDFLDRSDDDKPEENQNEQNQQEQNSQQPNTNNNEINNIY